MNNFKVGDKVAVMDYGENTLDVGKFIDYIGNDTLTIDGFFGFKEYDTNSCKFKLINDLQHSELKARLKAICELECQINKLNNKMWEIIYR